MSENVPEKRLNKSTNLITKEVAKMRLNPKLSGKENVVAAIIENNKPAAKKVRTTRKAVRRISKPVTLMDVEETEQIDTQKHSLPDGVIDIDAGDSEDPQQCAEYAVEIYQYLRSLESRTEYRVKRDYLMNCSINSKMRAVLVDWLVDVQQQFKLLQETLFLTISIIDRYLAVAGQHIHHTQLQLVGVAAMFVAAKLEEIFCPVIGDFVYITDDAYTKKEIRHMERTIINTLQFDLYPPISLRFLRRYSKAGDVDYTQHNIAKYILEQSLLDYTLVSIPASMKAAAALYLSLLITNDGDDVSVWNKNLEYYSSYSDKELLPIVNLLSKMLNKAAQNTKLQAVKNKYSSSTFMHVAKLPQLQVCSMYDPGQIQDN